MRADRVLDRERRRATVTYQVEAGPRWQVGRVLFEGELGPFTAAELQQAIDLGPDDPFRSQALETAAEKLRRFYIERKYRTAEVGEPTTIFDEAGRRVDVLYPVEAGPRITFEVEGAEISKLRKQGLLPFLGDEGFDEALLLQAVDRIHTYFQEQGHYLVQVSTREEETPEGVRVVIVVDEGPVYELEEVRFVGNEEVADDQLAELMQTSDDRLLGLGAGRLVTTVLESDLDNVRAWLALNGWAGYEVGPPEIDVEGQESRLTFELAEGVRRTVEQIEFTGVEALEQEEVDPVMEIEPGGPYHPVLVEESLEALRSLYQSRGYADEGWTLINMTAMPEAVLARELLKRADSRITVRIGRLRDERERVEHEVSARARRNRLSGDRWHDPRTRPERRHAIEQHVLRLEQRAVLGGVGNFEDEPLAAPVHKQKVLIALARQKAHSARMSLVEILDDDAAFRQHAVSVPQRRHHAHGRERPVGREHRDRVALDLLHR